MKRYNVQVLDTKLRVIFHFVMDAVQSTDAIAAVRCVFPTIEVMRGRYRAYATQNAAAVPDCDTWEAL